MDTINQARVSKDGTRLLCGRNLIDQNRCGHQLASIPQGTGELHLGSGWKQNDEGVYVLTTRSRTKVAAGGDARFRRKAPVVEGKSGGIHGYAGAYFTRDKLPIRIKCSRCGLVNVVVREIIQE
jgi:hypothetical protein